MTFPSIFFSPNGLGSTAEGSCVRFGLFFTYTT